MDLGVVAALTHDGIGITDLALAVEQAGLESLFLFEHTHLPVARRDLLDDPCRRWGQVLVFGPLGGTAEGPEHCLPSLCASSDRSLLTDEVSIARH
jgi:hypothetical protein